MGFQLEKGGRRKIAETIKENTSSVIREALMTGNRELFLEQVIENVPWKRLSLLWEILMESDLTNLEELENQIYAYGSSLSAKDQLGRLLFARMAILLRNAQNVKWE